MKMYFTLTGCNYRYGTDIIERGTKLKLKKEPDNEYDREAIMVKMKGLGLIGYVANSIYTVKGESMSAGRLYDHIGKKAKAEVVTVIPGGAICRVTDDGLKKTEEEAEKEVPLQG